MEVLVLVVPLAAVLATVVVGVVLALQPPEARLPMAKAVAAKLAVTFVVFLIPALVGDWFQQRPRPTPPHELLSTFVTVASLLALLALITFAVVLGSFALNLATRALRHAAMTCHLGLGG